jgi:hypothetical protein
MIDDQTGAHRADDGDVDFRGVHAAQQFRRVEREIGLVAEHGVCVDDPRSPSHAVALRNLARWER